MIPQSAIENLQAFAKKCEQKGYSKSFITDTSTNKYELKLAKDDNTVIIRDGYYNDVFTKGNTSTTSFDVVIKFDNVVFAQYFSDYTLDEYNSILAEAFDLVASFSEGKFNISKEKSFLGREKLYLNIDVNGRVEHLLGKRLDNA